MSQEYVGTKIVKAWPGDRDGIPGYKVQYKDGYISWSPKATFEESYLPLGHLTFLPESQQQLIAEAVQLETRLTKLTEFLDSDKGRELGLSSEELADQREQQCFMAEYLTVLKRRLARVQPAVTE